MIPADALVLLDTSVLVHLARGKQAAEIIDSSYALRGRKERPLISVVTQGEMMAFARNHGWGDDKVGRLRVLLKELVTIDINSPDIIDRYAVLSDFCLRNGLSVGDNDRWIAATAAVTDSWLLTADKDFHPLFPGRFKHEYVDPESLR